MSVHPASRAEAEEALKRTSYSEFDFRYEVPLFLLLPLLLIWGPLALRAIPAIILGFSLVSVLSLLLLANFSPTKLQSLLPDPAIRAIIILAAPSSDALRVLQEKWQDYLKRRSPSSSSSRERRRSRVSSSRSYPGPVLSVDHLQLLEANGEYERLIVNLRKLLKRDEALWSHRWVKDWIGRRWRNLFIREAMNDPVALSLATRRSLFSALGFVDARPPSQRIAERFLKGSGPLEYDRVEGGEREDVFPFPPFLSPSSLDVGLLFCPGLLNGLIPLRAFHEELSEIERRFSLKVIRADSHPLSSCERNKEDILLAINKGKGLGADRREREGDGKPPFDKFLAIGYSKGVPDILRTYVDCEDFRSRCVGIFSVAGAIGGSFLANNLWDTLKGYDDTWWLKNVDAIVTKIIPPLKIIRPRRFGETNLRDAIYDVTTYGRERFLSRHREELEAMKIPVMCLTGSCTAAEVPFFQVQGALMLNIYDNNNDMQLTEKQALLSSPTAMHLARLHANHWDMTLPPFPFSLSLGAGQLDHPLPKRALLSSIVMMAAELGLLSSTLDDEEEERDKREREQKSTSNLEVSSLSSSPQRTAEKSAEVA